MAPATESQKRAQKRWLEKNKEHKKAYMEQWKQDNLEHYRVRARNTASAYYYRNREEICRKRREKYLLECLSTEKQADAEDLATQSDISDLTDWSTVVDDSTVETPAPAPPAPETKPPPQMPIGFITHPLFRKI